MKQTPIDWLVEKLNQCEPWYSGTNVPKDHIDNLIKQAKKLEEINNDFHYLRGKEETLNKFKKDNLATISNIEIDYNS